MISSGSGFRMFGAEELTQFDAMGIVLSNVLAFSPVREGE
jgi:hypothetical protein